jgi:hypothetical protein
MNMPVRFWRCLFGVGWCLFWASDHLLGVAANFTDPPLLPDMAFAPALGARVQAPVLATTPLHLTTRAVILPADNATPRGRITWVYRSVPAVAGQLDSGQLYGQFDGQPHGQNPLVVIPVKLVKIAVANPPLFATLGLGPGWIETRQKKVYGRFRLNGQP